MLFSKITNCIMTIHCYVNSFPMRIVPRHILLAMPRRKISRSLYGTQCANLKDFPLPSRYLSGHPWKDKTHGRQCKMSSSKKITYKGTLRQVFICLRPRTPYPPPRTHYIRLRVYSILIHTGRGGGGEMNQIEG